MTPANPEKLQAGRKSGRQTVRVGKQSVSAQGKTCYDADNGTGDSVADPATALASALTGPNDQRRDPANERQPNYQHKDHKILLSASSEGPGRYPGLSCLKLQCFAQEPVMPPPKEKAF